MLYAQFLRLPKKSNLIMSNSNIIADYNVVCFLTRDGEFTPLSSLVVTSFTKHSSFSSVMKEAHIRTEPLTKALEMCHSVPWKCLVTIVYSGAHVKHLHRHYLINYENQGIK